MILNRARWSFWSKNIKMDSKKGETRGMDVWIHCYYREFTAKYSTPDSILTVNNYKLYSIIYSSTLYA